MIITVTSEMTARATNVVRDVQPANFDVDSPKMPMSHIPISFACATSPRCVAL